MAKTVSWAVAGPTRTLIQAGPSYAIVEGIDAFFWDMSDRQYAAAVVLLTMLLGFIQATVENGLEKAILRKVPPTDVPVVDAQTPEEDEDVDPAVNDHLPEEPEVSVVDVYGENPEGGAPGPVLK